MGFERELSSVYSMSPSSTFPASSIYFCIEKGLHDFPELLAVITNSDHQPSSTFPDIMVWVVLE